MKWKNNIKLIISSINMWLNGLKPLSFIFFMSLSSYVLTAVALPVLLLIGENHEISYSQQSILEALFLLIIIAPIIETIIFQYWVIKISRKLFKLNDSISILISAIVFGLIHSDSISHQVIAFTSGLILAYSFVIYEKKEFSASLMVIILHAIRNIPALVYTIVA
jgi:hypothetical protein